MMLRLLLLFTSFSHIASHPASCTEDSQCSSGFYCEESAHVCFACLYCEKLQRQSTPPLDLCVKSVAQCGPCLEGLVADKLTAACISDSEDEGAPHAYLPVYAWAAIAIATFLMITTLCVFLKTKTFKVIASSRTSVQSLRAADAPVACQLAAPPPYNYHVPLEMIPSGTMHADAPEIQRLVDSPQLSKRRSLESRTLRPREASTSQAARVYNHPSYVRMPHDIPRCNSPEGSRSSPDETTVPGTFDVVHPQQINNNIKSDDFLPVSAPGGESYVPRQLRNIACDKEQDSNNNQPSADGSPKSEYNGDAPSRDAFFIGGPSFVINVVENVNSLRQNNEAHFCRSDSS